MKLIIFGSILMLLTVHLFAQSSQNQDGPPKPPPVSERWKRDSIKLQLYVNIREDQMAGTKNAFLSFYKGLDEWAPKEKMSPQKKKEMHSLSKARNEALKKILDEKQFDRFETFEREFMPSHPPMPGEMRMPPSQL